MDDRRHQFLKLEESLPQESTNIDDEARRVLQLLCTEAIHAFDKDEFPIPPTDPSVCPNCMQLVRSATSPYCSDLCREEAAFVRQFRTGLKTGVVFDVERQANFGQNLWHLLGGGFPRRAALITPSSLKKILDRGCEICQEPAVMVDHTGSG